MGLKARMFVALAFLPSYKVVMPLHSCKDEDFHHYIDYFEKTFIGYYKSSIRHGKLTLKWKTQLFSIECWNIYDRVLANDQRTTIFLEGWHRRFSCVVGVSHPDIDKFISSLKGEQVRTEMVVSSLLLGEEIDLPG
jgi:hypothetical protein